MGTARKKYPEFELPPVLTAAIAEWLGPASMAKLLPQQRKEIAELANRMSGELGDILVLEPT